jgi:CRISPR-associated protein Cas4
MKKGSDFHESVLYAKNNDHQSHAILNKIAPKDSTIIQYHDVYFESKTLHLGARLDIFENEGGNIYPVEIKTGSKPKCGEASHHYIQLTAQALLLEEKFHTIVTRARIVYLGGDRPETEWIDLNLEMKRKLLVAIRQVAQNYAHETIPNVVSEPEKCYGCEYEWICQKT